MILVKWGSEGRRSLGWESDDRDPHGPGSGGLLRNTLHGPSCIGTQLARPVSLSRRSTGPVCGVRDGKWGARGCRMARSHGSGAQADLDLGAGKLGVLGHALSLLASASLPANRDMSVFPGDGVKRGRNQLQECLGNVRALGSSPLKPHCLPLGGSQSG